MYTKILVQNSSVLPEALQACLIAARAQFPLESSCFFLRSLLQSLALNYQKSKQLYDTYILWNQYWPHHLPNWHLSEMEIDPYA